MPELSHRQGKLILVPYAERLGANSGVNISNDKNRQDIYLKNCCVSACSAKQYNSDCDVAIATNIDLPERYVQILAQNDIAVIKIPFDLFKFDNTYLWSLAFYKLCVLYHMAHEGKYQYYAYMDTDVYVQSSFDNIWVECDHNILLYDINHGLQVNDYRIFLDEVNDFLGQRQLLTHYGGEFFAANYEMALLFSEKCLSVYHEILRRNFVTTKGDEFILSLVAAEIKNNIKNAGAYIYRFWTGTFRLVSTNYDHNAVNILHVPAEKERGMLRLYDRYISKGKKISSSKVHGILHLRHPVLKYWVMTQLRKIRAK